MKFFNELKEKIKKRSESRRKLAEEKIKSQQIQKRWKTKQKSHKKHGLSYYLEKAGLNIDTKRLSKVIFNICIIINLAISAFLLFHFSGNYGYSVYYVLFVMAIVWIFVFVAILIVIWLFFYLIMDLRIFQRKVTIEEVLPDYLQLVSANIRSGMPIDRALWYAVRPRFGVLAKEIEIVAKQTMSGEELDKALIGFSKKYNSPILERSINLLVEGLNAGGEIGNLLNKIASNIQESQILKKELGANVMSYVMFLTFSTVVAAPVLFGLSLQLLHITQGIMGNIDMPAGSNMGMPISLGGEPTISEQDFKIFAYTSLAVTSFFSSVIIATIRKGDVKAGVKYIPTFILISIVIFIIASKIMGKMFAAFF